MASYYARLNADKWAPSKRRRTPPSRSLPNHAERAGRPGRHSSENRRSQSAGCSRSTPVVPDEFNRRTQARVAELQEQHRRAGRIFERAETLLILCEEYTIGEGRASERRRQFRVFRWYGSSSSTGRSTAASATHCVCTVDGVPYADLNTRPRSTPGWDIINAFHDPWGSPPRCLRITRNQSSRSCPTGAQVVRLVVDGSAASMTDIGAHARREVA